MAVADVRDVLVVLMVVLAVLVVVLVGFVVVTSVVVVSVAVVVTTGTLTLVLAGGAGGGLPEAAVPPLPCIRTFHETTAFVVLVTDDCTVSVYLARSVRAREQSKRREEGRGRRSTHVPSSARTCTPVDP